MLILFYRTTVLFERSVPFLASVNPQYHYITHRHKHRPLQINVVCRLSYVPDLFFASYCLFASSSLWILQFHFCAYRPHHRPVQMNPVCTFILCSRSILQFGYSVHIFLPLWNPQDHYCTHRPNHRPLHMNPCCRFTLSSRSILRFGKSVTFLASVTPTGSLLSSQTQPPSLANESSL
jgi:hypothetical protein